LVCSNDTLDALRDNPLAGNNGFRHVRDWYVRCEQHRVLRLTAIRKKESRLLQSD
jgi:hypothetical protein